jgi:hypothetical protein
MPYVFLEINISHRRNPAAYGKCDKGGIVLTKTLVGLAALGGIATG